MKISSFSLVAFALMTCSLSWALKVTNLSNRLYEVTFIKNDKNSPICLLGSQDHITDLEAFGLEAPGKEQEHALVSVKLQPYRAEGSALIWEKLPPETELLIPAEPLLVADNPDEKKSSYAQYLGNIANFSVYYGGILVSIPLGALVSMEPAAQLGGVLGPTLIPHLALNLAGYTFFNPLHYFSGGLVGVIGGYAVGAVGGALLLPLVFSTVYKGGAQLVSYYIKKKESPRLQAQRNLEDSWVYLPEGPADDLSLDDWVEVEEELPNT